MMDNSALNITANSHLPEAMTLAFDLAPGGKATHFRIDNGEPPRLVFGWDGKMKNAQPLVAPVDAERAVNLAIDWLKSIDWLKIPVEDFDGSTGRAWRLYTETWGRVGGDPYAFAAIEPVIAYFGK